jgi:hypothetical protein
MAPLGLRKSVLQFLRCDWVIGLILLTLLLLVFRNNIPFNIKSITLHSQESYQFTRRSKFPSFICDTASIPRFASDSDYSFEAHRKRVLLKYCDILPIPRRNWIRAKTYAERDIAFAIFTGLSHYQNRATAVRDTWISRTNKYYFISATPYSYLPVTVVNGTGEDKVSNTKKHFYGLKTIYQQQMSLDPKDRQKWFYIAGCDTFIVVPHLLKRLDGLDYTQPMLVGSYIGREYCPGKKNTTYSIPFPSGGAGFFFSFTLLEIMQPHLSHYVENVWPQDSINSDVALTCLADKLGVSLTGVSGFWRDTPMATLKEHGRENLHNDTEINSFHYISPEEMYSLDEFYAFQHVDRLANDGNLHELTEFTTRFIAAHYELLRLKRR